MKAVRYVRLARFETTHAGVCAIWIHAFVIT